MISKCMLTCIGHITSYLSCKSLQTLLRDQSPFLRPGELAQLIHRGFAENGNISADQGTHLDEVQNNFYLGFWQVLTKVLCTL